ncbi:MAG: glycine/betaine/sarcosine/D-proline family reductase selenoprotein B [Gammaproteobacteria bacterium]|nr:glycine/betaine/sarcosine/D-proline family reductase selenoprotein B [Gammaproteobacteria bacterium]
MVRLTDLADYEAKHLLDKPCPKLQPQAWVVPPTLSEARVALITTAGIHNRESREFELADSSYRVIAEDATDLLMTHASVNFDRSGFQEDINVVFPLDRLRELADGGQIGSVAEYHYSFMGAGLEPHAYEQSANDVAALLKRDAVDLVLLTPV